LGLSLEDLRKEIFPIRALYAIADHTRNLLFAIRDGALPSNVGGGYNLRNILRRCYSLLEEFQLSGVDFPKIFELHIEELGSWFPELKETGSLYEILSLEKDRYKETRQKNEKLIRKILKEKKSITTEQLVELYDSQGVTPELVHQIERTIEIPDDFYLRVQERHEKSQRQEKRTILKSEAPPTKQLYYEASYEGKNQFKAKILDIVDNEWIVLNQTHFYPEGGGQAADVGKINHIDVLDVQIDSGVIFHKVLNPQGFRKGQNISGQVDWARRYHLMKLHSVTHLINAVAKDVLGNHIWQAGAKKTPEKAHLDITHFRNITEKELAEIERITNHLISEEPIESTIKYYPRDQAEKLFGMEIYQGGAIPSTNLRVVSFKDNEACSGTHLHSTGEAGFVKIISAERIQDGIVRLTFEVGDKAVERIQHHENLLKELSTLWKVSYDDVPKTGSKFFDEWKKLGKKILNLQEEIISGQLGMVPGIPDPEVWIETAVEDQGIIQSALLNAAKTTEKTIVVYSRPTKTLFAVSGDPKTNLGEYLRPFAASVKDGKLVRAFQVDETMIMKQLGKNR
ncbi:MAG TPA: alanine--tRNA ligase-related protein, partial [Candidatus Hodarchaeales archaeon]|nr:alanine--tRNA ligase-related protein [Candidatus Hodarchaeales archaeon]